jgi:predicted nucleic acid-binding protein
LFLDSCFLIDLQREKRADREGPARRFLTRHGEVRFSISVIVSMEFCEGFSDKDLWSARGFLDLFHLAHVDEHVALRASRIRRKLRETGQLVPDNDILIAATALEGGEPLVTKNTLHFKRIGALKLLDYSSGT